MANGEPIEVRLARIEMSTANIEKILEKADLPAIANSVAVHDRVLWAVATAALGALGLGLWKLMPH